MNPFNEKRFQPLALLACLLTLLVVPACKPSGKGAASIPPVPASVRVRSLAILPFENNAVTSPEKYGPLQSGLAAMLTTELSRQALGLDLIERTRIRELMGEMKLSLSGAVDDGTAVKMGKILGADAIALGSFMVIGDRVRLDARVVDVETSRVLLAECVSGDPDRFLALVDDLSRIMARALAQACPPPSPGPETGSMDSALLFSRAVSALDQNDDRAAERLFDQLTRQDPAYKGVVSRLRDNSRP